MYFIFVVLFSFFCLFQAPRVQSPDKEPNKFEKEIVAFEELDKKQPVKTGGILFVGSSTIRKWKLSNNFPDRSDLINRGFGGSEISDSVKYANRIIIPYKPRQIVFYAGDNDLANSKKPETLLEDYRQLVKVIRQSLPDTEILFLCIKPSPSREKLLPFQNQANALIEAEIQKDPKSKFIDFRKAILDRNGMAKPELFEKDLLHLNLDGYVQVAEVLKPYLK
jgi:lysophospholipase L1-like esterase